MRMQLAGFTVVVAWAGFAGVCAADPAGDWQGLVLWYTQPAKQWTEALPIGNGKLAADLTPAEASEILSRSAFTVSAKATSISAKMKAPCAKS